MDKTYKRKDMFGIPWRLAFAMQDDGWYLRQDIIWYKPNCMPESVTDRCTSSYEHIFLLSKSEKYHFDYKAIEEPAVSNNVYLPAGSKGTLRPNLRERVPDTKKKYKEAQTKRRKRDVWSISAHGYKGGEGEHFAAFPDKLAETCILAGCPSNGVVLDPFIGSGTVAVVAEKLNRSCIGIDINPDYVDLVNKRIKKEKGKD